jgi:hypothetical protein
MLDVSKSKKKISSKKNMLYVRKKNKNCDCFQAEFLSPEKPIFFHFFRAKQKKKVLS